MHCTCSTLQYFTKKKKIRAHTAETSLFKILKSKIRPFPTATAPSASKHHATSPIFFLHHIVIASLATQLAHHLHSLVLPDLTPRPRHDPRFPTCQKRRQAPIHTRTIRRQTAPNNPQLHSLSAPTCPHHLRLPFPSYRILFSSSTAEKT